jgi:hypothetical protein
MTILYLIAKFWVSIFLTVKWQRSKLLHSVTRQDSEPVAFDFLYTHCKVIIVSLLGGLKTNITQKIFATKILYAFIVSAALNIQLLVAFKTVSCCNNSM